MVVIEFQELPFAVIERILEQLDAKSIGSLSKTCKSIQDIVRRFNSSRKNLAESSLLKIPKELIHEILKNLDVDGIKFMAKSCKHLRSSVDEFQSKYPSIMEKKWDDYDYGWDGYDCEDYYEDFRPPS